MNDVAVKLHHGLPSIKDGLTDSIKGDIGVAKIVDCYLTSLLSTTTKRFLFVSLLNV